MSDTKTSDYNIVLACLTDPETAPQTLDVAIRLAREFGAQVDALHVRSDPASAVPLIGEGMSGAMVEEVMKAAEQQGGELSRGVRQHFDQACARLNFPVVTDRRHSGYPAAFWREETGNEEDIVAAAGKLADIIVAPRLRQGEDVPSPLTVNAALIETGRPVMIAPPGIAADMGNSVVIFWNGSSQAARAVAFSMPILRRAKKVTVVAAHGEGDASPEELAHYLARKGVKADYSSFTSKMGGEDVARGLLTEAQTANADIIVMGAYSRSRVRQLILGGVTQHIITYASIPVLLVR